MDRIINYSVTEKYNGMKVLDFLRKNGFSGNILTSMKEIEDAIQLNGSPAGGRILLNAGDRLKIHIPETASMQKTGHFSGRNIPEILFEDKDLVIINKPADMPVHPSVGNHENTLADYMAVYFERLNLNCPFRCINRLDRDTSGVLILAKNPLSASVLGADMRARKIRRTYLAIVRGLTPEEGTITAPIGRAEGSVLMRCVDWEHGDSAVTHYRRLGFRDGYSLLEIRLETGRTHQIRVHMSYLGFPLPADYLYYPDYSCFNRQPLHSWKLAFLHPITGKKLSFTAPVPEDMNNML